MDLKAQWEQFCSMVRGWGAVPTSISPERASSVFGAIHENAVFVLRGDAAPSPAASEAITSSLSADTPPSLKKELVYAKLHRIHNSASCLIRAPMSHRSGMRRSPSIATDDSARSLIQSRTTMSSAAANDHHSATEEYSRSPSLRVVLPHPLIIHAEAPMALVGIHFTSRVQLTGPAPVFFVGCGFSEDRHRGSIREYISLGALLHPTAPLPPTISSAGVPQNDGAGSATTPRDAPLDHPLHLLPPTPSPRTSTPTTGEEEERVSQYTANWLQAGAALRSSRSSRSGDDDADINAAADDQMLQSSAQPMAGVGTAFSLATTTAGASVVPWVAMVGQRPASRSQPRIMNPALMSGGGATGGGATGAGGGGGGGGGASMAACSSAMSAIEVSGSAQCFLGQCDIFGGFSGTGLCCRDECVVCLQDCSLGGPSTTWAAIELHDAAQLSASYTTIAEAVGSGVVLSGMATALLHFSVLQRCGVVGVLATERSSITLTETDVEMSGSGINLAASAHASCHLEKCVLTARLPVGSVMGKPALDGTTAAHVGAEEEEDEQQDAAPPAPLPATTTSAEVEARLVDLLRTDLHIISHHYGGGGIPFCSQSIVVVDQAQVTLEECELACRIPTNTPAPSTDVSSLTTVATATPLPTAGTPGFTSASTSVDVLAWLPSDVESLAAGILTRHSITRQQVGDFIHRIRQPLVHESGGLMPRSQCGGSHNSTSSRLSQRVLPWLHPERVYSMEFSAYPSSNISDELLGTTSSKRILREEEEDGQLAMFGSLLSLGAHPAMLAAGGVCHVTARDAAHVRLQRCIIALHDYTMTTGPPMTVKMPFMNPAALNSPTSPLPVSAATPTNPATSAGEAVAPPPPPPPQTTTTATSDAPSVSAPPRSQPCVGVLADLTPFASCPLDLSRPTALRPSLLTTSSSSSPGQPPAVSPTSTTELSSDLSRPSLSTARLTVESERNVVIFEAPSNARRDDGPRSRQHHLGNNWAMVMICPTDLAGCEAAWPAGGPAEELAMRQLMAVGLEKEWVAVAVEVEEEEEETDRGPSPSSPNLPTTAPQLTTTLGPESTTSSSGTAVGESEVDPDLTPADGTSTNNNNNNTNNNNGRSTSGGKSAMASSSSSHRSSRPRPLDHIHIHGNIFLNPRHPATDLLEIHRERICTNLTTFARHNALHLEELYFIPTHTAAVSDNGTDGGEDDAEHHRTTANSTPERATTTTTTTTTTSMMDVGTSPKVAAIHLTLRSEMILGDVDAPPMAAERLLHSEGADSAQQQQQQQPDAVVVREAATLDLSDAEDGRQTPIAATVVVGGGGSPESTATPRRRTQPSSLLHSPSANTSAASSCQSEIVLSERFGGSPMAMAAGDGSTPAYVRSPAGAESVDRSGSLSFRNGGWQKKLATPLSPGDSPRTLQRSTSGLRPVFLLDEAMVADVGRPTFSTVVSPTSLPTTTTTTTTATTSASTAISSMVAMSEYSPPRSMGMMEEVGHLTPANTCSVAHYKEELIHAMHEVILGHPPPHPTHSATADDAADDDGSGVVAVDAASSRVDESHESPSPPRTCAGDPIRTQPPSQRPSVSVEELMRAGPRSPTTPNTLEAFTLHSSGKGSLETQRPEDVFCMMEPATDSRSEESGESPHLQRDEVLSEDVVVATAEEDEVVRGALESTVGPSSPVETEGADVSPPREVQVHEEEEDEDEDVVGNVAFTNPNHMVIPSQRLHSPPSPPPFTATSSCSPSTYPVASSPQMLSAYLLPEILGAEVAHLDNNSFCSTVRPESTDRRLSYRARMLSLSTDDSPDVPGSSTALHLHRDLHEARQAIEVLQSEIHELKQMLLPATPPHVAMAANASTTLNAADESGPIETPRTARGPTTVEVFNETASPRMVLAMQNQQQPMMLVEVEAPRGSTSHDVPASIQVPNTHDGSSSEGSPMMISRQATDAPPPPPQQQQQQDSWSRTRGTDSGGGEDELLTDTSASFFQGQPGDGGSASPLGAGATTSTAPFTPPPLSPTPKQRRAAARAKESAKRSTSTHHRLPAKVAATTERLASPAPRPKPATKDKKRGPATTSTTPSRPRPPPLTPPTHTTATTTTAPPQRTTTLPHPSRRDLLQSMADYSPPVAHGGSSFAHALQHLIRGTTSPGGCAAAALLRSRGGPATPITPRDGAHVDGQTASAQRWGSDLLAQLVKIHKQPMGSTQPSHQPKQVPLRGAMSAPRELWRSPYAPPPPTATSSSSSSNTTTAAAETTSIHRRAASASSPLSSHPVFGQRCDIDGNTTAPPHPYHDSRGEERKMEEPTATTTPSPASGPFHDPQNSSAEPHASSTAEHRRRLRPASALPPQTSKNDPHGPTSSSSSYASSPPAAAANTSEATTTSMRSCYISPWMQGENHHHDDDDAMQRRNEPLPVGPARLHVRYVQAQRARQAWDAFADAMEDDALEQRRLSPERQSGMIERLYAHPLREALQRAKRMEKNTPSSVVS